MIAVTISMLTRHSSPHLWVISPTLGAPAQSPPSARVFTISGVLNVGGEPFPYRHLGRAVCQIVFPVDIQSGNKLWSARARTITTFSWVTGHGLLPISVVQANCRFIRVHRQKLVR